MRLIFFTVGLFSDILLFIFIQMLIRKQDALRNAILKLFIASFFAVLANLIIAVSRVELLTGLAFSLYFSSIDFITYYFLLFAFVYTNRPRFLNIFRTGWRIIAIIDTLSLFVSVWTGHMFTVYSMTLADGSVAYQTTPALLFNIHLALCYLPILFTMYLLASSLFKSVGFYRFKYFPILVSLLAIVLLNIAYMYFLLPFDWSVLLYALAGILLYFFSQSYVPRKLMNSSLQLAVDSMKEGLFLFDSDRNIVYINKRAHDLFDLSIDSFSFDDYPISLWLTGKDRSNLKEFVENHPMMIKGSRMIIKVDYRNSVNSKGQDLGSFFLFEDVTQDQNLMKSLEEARSEANRANDAKSMFLANMSHEIRTPINSILGMNEMILRESQDWDIIGYAQDIKRSGDALLSLINNILDFSRIESGKMDISPEGYNIFRMLRECYHLVASRAQQKDLPILIECPDDLPEELYGDAQRIKQILVNLLTNSIKYTREGSIRLAVKWKPTSSSYGEVRFVVTDSGQGISEENIAKLFRIFERVDLDHNRNIEGTGLGLAISRQLAFMMGGDITVVSTPGKGSEFTVILPQKIISEKPLGRFVMADEDVPKADRYKASFLAPDAHILAVDDIDLNLKLIASLLKKTGLSVTLAAGGDIAVQLCKEQDFDLILMDHMMPDPDGIEAMKMIREAGGHNANIPIIVLTANAIEGAEQEYLKAGFDAYLSKPVLGSDLEDMIVRFLPKDKVQK